MHYYIVTSSTNPPTIAYHHIDIVSVYHAHIPLHYVLITRARTYINGTSSLQLLLPADCVDPLQLLLSPIVSASAAAPRLRPLVITHTQYKALPLT